MVSPKSITQKEVKTNEPTLKKERKKKGYRGETVADRLLASARRMEQMRLSENMETTSHVNNNQTTKQETGKQRDPVKLSKLEKLGKATHEIDDLSALEWETSSEQSGI